MSAAYALDLVLGLLHVLQDAPGEAEDVVDRAHPLGVAPGEVVVDGDDVDAVAGERVEADGERGGERLALAGLHLGDVAAVEDHAADQLHVEVAHAHRAPAGLADEREALGEHVVEVLAVLADPLAQGAHALAQILVGERDQLVLERPDRGNALLVLAELLALTDVQRSLQQTHGPQDSDGARPPLPAGRGPEGLGGELARDLHLGLEVADRGGALAALADALVAQLLDLAVKVVGHLARARTTSRARRPWP